MFPGLLPSALFDVDHDTFRETVRRFVDKAVLPHIDAWEEAETFPRALYREAADLGLLGIGFPEEYGGTPGDLFLELAMIEELTRAASGGLLASLFSHTIGAPPIVAGGSAELKARVLPAILSGEKISALAITEPSGGSDVASLTTRAVRDGDHYVVNGSKIFITSGMRADYITVAARTGEAGAGGISALLVEGDTPGLSRTPLKKMGWWCSDTAQLHFDNCRVPVGNLLGAENRGFELVMRNFNHERLALAMQAYGLAHVSDRSRGMGHPARDLRQAPRAAPGGASEAGDDGHAHRSHPGVAGRPDAAHAGRRFSGRAAVHAEKFRNAELAVLRGHGRATAWRYGLHARHQVGAHLS